MGRTLATFATMLILLLGAAFAVPAFVDWNSYRSSIEKAASGVLGRKVSILGDIDIVLLPEPHLHADNVAAGNGKADGVLLTAGGVDVSLSLEALFGGRIDASRLRLVHPVLTFDFSKPFLEPAAGLEDALPFTAGVKNIEIEGGRVSVFSKGGGNAEALALTNINGTASAPSSGSAYRFSGSVSKDGRQYDVKFSASQAKERVLKLAGTAVDSVSKVSFQTDGLVKAGGEPSFEGSLTVNVPRSTAGTDRLPFDVLAKSSARIGLADASLDDLELTLDPQNRPQLMTGSAKIGFRAGTASIALKTSSLDADALLGGSAWPGAAGAAAPGDWTTLTAVAENLLWLYPTYALNLDIDADQVQLRGEPVQGVKLHGTRKRDRWIFDEALATLPGETAVKLAGTLTKPPQGSQLIASVALDGKSAGRLARWLVPAAAGRRLPPGPFSISGSLTLSPGVSAFEGVTGKLDGMPFTAGLHFDKAPVRRLQASLAGDNFDLSAFEGGESAGALSPDNLKASWREGLTQLSSMLGAGEEGFDTADVDISAGDVKTAAAEVKNVAVHLKYDRDLLTVSKLNAETPSGLVLRGEGSVPLGGTGQGRFNGRIEAPSPQAIIQMAALAGYDRGSVERRAAGIAPAALSVSYSAEAGAGAAAQLTGNLGPGRIEGRAHFKGSLSDWKAGELSAQFDFSEPDGNKLVWLLFPDAVLSPGSGPSPGAVTISLNGPAGQLQTSASLKTDALDLRLDGAASLKPLSFKGKASASSQAPEQFFPPSALALLGGEPKAALHVGANITATDSSLDATELSADSPGNLVTGRIAIEKPDAITRVNASLTAEKASLPSLLAYFLSAAQPDALLQPPASLTAAPPPPDMWSSRPFALSALQETEGAVSLTANSLQLSEAVSLTGARLRATLENGHLDIASLSGKTLGGTLDASLSLAAKESVVSADTEVALSGVDLAAVAAPGAPPAISGQAWITLAASGQGLSPRGIVSVLHGRGTVRLGDGSLPRLSPSGVQARADELTAQQQPLTEEAVTAKVLEAAQSSDFNFHGLKVPVSVSDGILEIKGASFRGEDATVRMEGYFDLGKALADTTWQIGASSGRHRKWPPVKLTWAGPLRELGAKPRTLAGEDLVRAILVRKMEGDIDRLEGLNKTPATSSIKPPAQAAKLPSSGWTATQEPAPKSTNRRKRNKDKPREAPATGPSEAPGRTFEQRMRDALENIGGSSAR